MSERKGLNNSSYICSIYFFSEWEPLPVLVWNSDVTSQSKIASSVLLKACHGVPQHQMKTSILQQVVVILATYFVFPRTGNRVWQCLQAKSCSLALQSGSSAPVGWDGERLCHSVSVIPSCGWECTADLLLTGRSYSSCPSVNSSLIT